MHQKKGFIQRKEKKKRRSFFYHHSARNSTVPLTWGSCRAPTHTSHTGLQPASHVQNRTLFQDGFSYLNHPSPESHHKVKTGSHGYRDQEVRITEPARGPAALTVLPTPWSTITKSQFPFLSPERDVACVRPKTYIKLALRIQSAEPLIFDTILIPISPTCLETGSGTHALARLFPGDIFI